MNLELSTQKVTASHLRRDAYLYIRQSTLRQVFENTESTQRQYALRERAVATVKFFRREKLPFPRRIRGGPRKGELIWGPLIHSRALQVLHNPRYAGAFAFGRSRHRKLGDGHVESRQLPQDQWHTLLLGAHPGYITWEQYQEHQQRLRDAAQSYGDDRRHGPAGEGPALLQGLALCGVCGRRMSIRYHRRPTGLLPQYVCQSESTQHGAEVCQSIHGQALDEAIGRLLLDLMTPVTLNVALAVQQELQARFEEVDRLRQQQVERARYEADLARQRYMQVDPGNRLVADALEAD